MDHIGMIAALGIIVIISIIAIPIPAEAAQPKRIIGIVIERSCLLSDKCLDYSDVVYLDRSNKVISGDFISEGDDIKRKCSKYQNNINWYSANRPKNLTIIVDPCFNQRTYIPIITIVSKLDWYKGHDQKQVKEVISGDMKPIKNKRVTSHTRYVNDQCNEAIIGYSQNWKNLIHDTINYLNYNCDPTHTKITTIQETYTNITKHDIATSSKYKLEKYYNTIKQDCLKSRNICTDLANKAVLTNGNQK